MVSYLLEIYATDDIIAEAEAEIVIFKKPAGMTTISYSEVLWEKSSSLGRGI